jgi:hypothetical protein
MDMTYDRLRLIALAGLGGAAAVLFGCNPNLGNLVGKSAGPVAPGSAGLVLAHVVNATSSDAQVFVGFEAPLFFPQPIAGDFTILAGSEHGIVLPCPVRRLSLGELDDASADAIVLTLEDGGKVTLTSGAFPYQLQQGVDFNCGDTVLFTMIQDRTSASGITVRTSRSPGEGQTGPFSGPDTFRNLELLLQLTGPPPIPAKTAP